MLSIGKNAQHKTLHGMGCLTSKPLRATCPQEQTACSFAAWCFVLSPVLCGASPAYYYLGMRTPVQSN